jgi:hypothetical protein
MRKHSLLEELFSMLAAQNEATEPDPCSISRSSCRLPGGAASLRAAALADDGDAQARRSPARRGPLSSGEMRRNPIVPKSNPSRLPDPEHGKPTMRADRT